MFSAQQQGEAWFPFRAFQRPLVDTRRNKRAATILANYFDRELLSSQYILKTEYFLSLFTHTHTHVVALM